MNPHPQRVCHKEESNLNFAPAIRATYTGYGEYSLITLPKVMMCHYKPSQKVLSHIQDHITLTGVEPATS